MKNKKIITLLTFITASFLVGCGSSSSSELVTTSNEISSESIASVISNTTSISSSSSSSASSESILEGYPQELEHVVSGTSYKKVALASGTSSAISEKYEVYNDTVVTDVIYKVSETTRFMTMNYYIGVNITTFKISGVGKIDKATTQRNADSKFDNNDLGLTGTDASDVDIVTGSTVSSNAIQTMAKAAIAQAKKDYQKA